MKKIISILAIALCVCVGVVCFAACAETTEFNRNEDINLIQREAGSGTRDAFESLLGLAGQVHTSAGQYNTTGSLRTAVANNKYSIGYVSVASVNDTVKALDIDGKEPSAANIKSNEYTLWRPFLMIIHKDVTLTSMTALAQDFHKYIFSTQGQAVVTGDGLVEVSTTGTYSAPATALTGTLNVIGSTSVQTVMNKIVEEYKKLNAGVTIVVDGTGSGQGRTEADKKLDNSFGIVSAELTAAQAAVYNPYQIAKDGVAVIVHKDNPLTGLTKAQVTDVFKGTATGSDKWSFVVE